MNVLKSNAALAAPSNTKQAPIAPETLAAIVAAATAFLGNAVELRAVKLLTGAQGNRWSRQGRATVHASHNLHARR
jgi:hypothetical protein